MLDTLKLAKDLREGQVFSPEQAERLAGAIAQAGDEKRLRDLDVRLGVLTWAGGILAALVLAVLWQLFAMRGDVSANAADTTARFDAVIQRLGAVEQRLGGIEQRLGGIERRLDVGGPARQPAPTGTP